MIKLTVMVKAGTITKGIFLKLGGEPVLVIEKEFYHPGKGASVVRLKLKNLKTNRLIQEVLKTDELVEKIEVNYQTVQFLYKTKNSFVFMNPQTFEQIEAEAAIIQDQEKYLKEGEKYTLATWNEEVVELVLPKKLAFTVIKAEKGVRGNTVSNATKPVTLDNNLIIQVPLFIQENDQILVNTETGEYAGKKS